MDAVHVPVRRCVGCGQRAPKRTLIRFVTVAAAGGHRLVRDDLQRAPGRGMYLCDRHACFLQALERRAFQRSARLSGESLDVDAALGDTLRRDGMVTDGHE